MSFYPNEGNGDDLEIENKYSEEDFGIEKKVDNQSDSFRVENNEKKSDPTSGIDHQELRKRIENFSLDNNENNRIVEDEEEVPSIKEEPKEELNEEDNSIEEIDKELEQDEYLIEDGEEDIPSLKEEVDKEIDGEEDLIVEDEEGVPSFKEEKVSKVEVNQNLVVEKKQDSSKLMTGPSKSKKEKIKPNESLSWYVKITRLPIFLIVLYSVLVLIRGYLITISSNLTNFAKSLTWFDNLKLPFEILVIIIATYVVIKKKKQLPRIAGITGMIIGFSAGVIISVIKLFWYREMWNIFYLSAESIFLGIIGLVVGLLSSALFYEEYK